MAKSTQGFELQLDVESALGVGAGSLFNVRLAENPTIPTIVKQVADVTVKGFSHFADQDAPVTYEAAQENGVTLPMHILRATTGAVPPLAVVGESAGMTATSEADDTAKTSGTHTVSKTELTTGASGSGYGACYLVYDDTADIWWPSLVALYGGTTATWMYKLANAQSDLAPVARMYSLTPESRQVPTDKTLKMILNTRAIYTSGDDWAYTMLGCACSSLGTLEIVPNQVPVLSPTFHVADVARSAVAMSNESFRDTQAKMVVGGNFFAGIGESKGAIGYATGGLERTNEFNLLKATIDFGVSVVPIPGTGSSCVNNVQGYMAQYDPAAAQITIEKVMPADYDPSQIKEWDDDSTKEFAIQLVQGVSGTATDPTVPCYGFFAPRCHLKSEPVHDPFGEAFHKVTEVYSFVPSEFDSAAFDETNAPYHFAVYTPSA